MRQELPYELDQRPIAAVVISSQLAYGSVGNNVIARLIERAGHRAVCVPTVVFSNLPHYPTLAGGPLLDSWLVGILDDLLARDVLRDASFVCVGYLAHAGQAQIVGEWFAKLRQTNPGVRLLVDPAMGDQDVGLYTSLEVVNGYIQHLLPLANALTPNNFELDLLTEGQTHTSVEEKARSLLTPDLEWVAVTSAAHHEANDSNVHTFVATREETFRVKTPFIESRAKGAGDFFVGTIVGALLSGSALTDAIAGAAGETATALAGQDPWFSPRTQAK
ncbi:bifunctional hydroxymethylpyrimidine kinase/phosphomethylpyrimidine kinase [Paeniglutamicibacter gangotriensis]|uniref:pyridoxal kinase n=1 Tax=Paeniglutamicibacter gangotriensis Lz1y TaxID=1276920 RepID=M7MQ44_9MICC|nr:PfkB family carbohydrate kinase [Paeniglutamicibacter gangotriensis]EMQ97156.1 phosphomethylpyrimidine kinase [Paeniglutamicibacter gangotriensis Lz1y]